MFESTGPHFCPECDPIFNKRGDQVGQHLSCTTHNYSGTGTDIAVCQNCHKSFIIAYKVESIQRIKDELTTQGPQS